MSWRCIIESPGGIQHWLRRSDDFDTEFLSCPSMANNGIIRMHILLSKAAVKCIASSRQRWPQTYVQPTTKLLRITWMVVETRAAVCTIPVPSKSPTTLLRPARYRTFALQKVLEQLLARRIHACAKIPSRSKYSGDRCANAGHL